MGVSLAACGAAGSSETTGAGASPIGGGTGSAALSWEAPTTRDDGSPLTDLAGYRLYVSLGSGVSLEPIDVGLQTEYTLANLASGAYRFAVSAYDAAGRESDLSLPVTKTIP